MSKIIEFIKKTPKVELHLHIEGTLEPEHLFRLAKKIISKFLFQMSMRLSQLIILKIWNLF